MGQRGEEELSKRLLLTAVLIITMLFGGMTVLADEPGGDTQEMKDIYDIDVHLDMEKAFYNGQEQKPKVICIDDGAQLEEGVDYQVTYESRDGAYTEPGVYYVSVLGIDRYYDARDLPFEIVKTEISLSAASKTLYIPNAFTLGAEVQNPDGDTAFESSDEAVAAVTPEGKVTAKKAGKATITVRNGNAEAACAVTVKKPQLSKKSVKVYNSTKFKLKFLGGTGKITWKSSKKAVAAVSSKGVITGKKAGKATITAKRGKYTFKCKVTVPSKYKGTNIPDYGAVMGKQTVEAEDDDGLRMLGYIDTKKHYNAYIKKIKKAGFVYMGKEDGIAVYAKNSRFVGLTFKKKLVVVAYEL